MRTHPFTWLSVSGLLTVGLFGCAERPTTAESKTTQAQAQALTEATIAWPKPASIDQRLRKSLSEEDRVSVDRTPMPVLWPSTQVVRTGYVGQDAFYSIAATSDVQVPSGARSTATITVQGTRKMIQHEDMPKKQPSNRTYRGQPAFYTVNEGIVSATWFEYGVIYTVDVECSTAEDSRCGGDGYVRDIVEGLRFVGGKQ